VKRNYEINVITTELIAEGKKVVKVNLGFFSKRVFLLDIISDRQSVSLKIKVGKEEESEEIEPNLMKSGGDYYIHIKYNEKISNFNIIFKLNIDSTVVFERYVVKKDELKIEKRRSTLWNTLSLFFLNSIIVLLYIYLFNIGNDSRILSNWLNIIAAFLISFVGIDLIGVFGFIKKMKSLSIGIMNSFTNHSIFSLLNKKIATICLGLLFFALLILSGLYFPIHLTNKDKFDYWRNGEKIEDDVIISDGNEVKFSLKNCSLFDTSRVIFLGTMEPSFFQHDLHYFNFQFYSSCAYPSNAQRINMEKILLNQFVTISDSMISDFLYRKPSPIDYRREARCFCINDSYTEFLESKPPPEQIYLLTSKYLLEKIQFVDTLWDYLRPCDSVNYLNWSKYNGPFDDKFCALETGFNQLLKEYKSLNRDINTIGQNELVNVCYRKLDSVNSYTGKSPFFSGGPRITFDILIYYRMILCAYKEVLDPNTFDYDRFARIIRQYFKGGFDGLDSRNLNMITMITSYLESTRFASNGQAKFSKLYYQLFERRKKLTKEAFSNKLLCVWYLFSNMYKMDCILDAEYKSLFRQYTQDMKQLNEFKAFYYIKPISKKNTQDYNSLLEKQQ
jgi:hypothetical protein